MEYTKEDYRKTILRNRGTMFVDNNSDAHRHRDFTLDGISWSWNVSREDYFDWKNLRSLKRYMKVNDEETKN